VWDDGLIEEARRGAAQHVVRLNTWLASQDADSLGRGGWIDWALETHRVAREQAYLDADGRPIPPRRAELGRGYLEARIGAVDRQLAVAGVRLARVLNEALR
jgi:hypothetical protein